MQNWVNSMPPSGIHDKAGFHQHFAHVR